MRWSDHRNFLSKLTWRKIANAGKIYTSYQMASAGATPKIMGLPIALSVEPTTSCNLRCPECPSGLRSFTRPTGMLAMDTYSDILRELSPTLAYLTLYFQGEPYLHPQFLNLVSEAAKQNIYTATSTNAHYLHSENARKTVESGLDRLIVSIDGTDQETYASYRVGGNLEKVLEGTRQVLHWKEKLKSATPHIIFQFLVVAPNEHQLKDVQSLADELGVDEVVYKTAQIYDFEGGSDLIPNDLSYSRYTPNGDGTWRLKHKLENKCWKMWHSSVITWDGKVVPCCFDKDAVHSLGSTDSQAFHNIWNGDAYNTFRKMVFQSRNEIEMCKNCTEGAKIWA